MYDPQLGREAPRRYVDRTDVYASGRRPGTSGHSHVASYACGGCVKLERRTFLVVSGCAALAWVAAATGPSDASAADLGAATLNVLIMIAGVWLGSVAVGRSRTGTWGADRAPAWMHASVVAVAAIVEEAGDAALSAIGMPVEPDAGPLGREVLQAAAFAAVFWAAYLLATRAPGALGAPAEPATAGGSCEAPASRRPSVENEGEAAATKVSGLLRLVRNPRVSASLEFIKAEGNYIDVQGAEGHELILYRFNQAVEDLAGVGMQVHRSYWVRRTAVRDMQRSGKTGRVTLASGREIPVSAPYLAAAQSLLHAPPRDAG